MNELLMILDQEQTSQDSNRLYVLFNSFRPQPVYQYVSYPYITRTKQVVW